VLVFTLSDEPGEDAYERVTVTLSAKEGWSSFFDRIEERLQAPRGA
jgi:hypothetical protein